MHTQIQVTGMSKRVAGSFPAFAEIVHRSFQAIASSNPFVVDVGADALYAAYLGAFPEGTNPILKARTEHDCSCCKQFVRHVGPVVAVLGGKFHTVWDEAAETAPYPYNEVARALQLLVVEANIADLYRVSQKESQFGARQTLSQNEAGDALTWDHFFTGEIPSGLRVASPGQVCGDYKTTVQVFERGLKELQPEALETVLSLVDANALYRGEEHKPALQQFQIAQHKFLAMGAMARELFVWTNAHGSAARFRNTVIGTLVQDLSDGVEVERAVSAFETKVAPQNYKRTSALITSMMVKKAMETIQTLGLEPALQRRFARIDDVSVNDVLWVDSRVQPLMKGGIGDVLMQHATTPDVAADEKHAEAIGLGDFLARILPETTAMEVLFKGQHLGNLMSLTAPVHPDPQQLFRWSNDFAWSYAGNLADSIKERVKRAGGEVEGVALRVSLSWFNFDDLDLHIIEPEHGHIYFGAKKGRTGGTLDVDMNAYGSRSREPVENVVWGRVPNGSYQVFVNNYTFRESSGPGFVIEVENNGKILHFSYSKGVRQGENVNVAMLHVKDGLFERIDVGQGITSSNIPQERWGLKTEQYVKVNAVTLSPNYWGDNAVGNKHTFFVLDGAKNDEPTRGIYNEFLHPRLEQHRKVFEVIGEKTKCQPTEGQLSGLGFSSTKPDAVIIRVTQGKKQRLFNVQIGA